MSINNIVYYPTLLRRVQITRETSTNITRYLYSSHSPDRPRERLKTLASQNFGETKTLDNKSLIRYFSAKYRCKFLHIICILTRENIQRYYTLKRLIRYIYCMKNFPPAFGTIRKTLMSKSPRPNFLTNSLRPRNASTEVLFERMNRTYII